jgi:UDPglucose 6-dehydrogenase
MQVTVIGAGYVGLTTGVTLAYLGHRVTVLDNNRELIRSLKSGTSPIYENGLDVVMQQARDNISFTCSFSGVNDSAIVIIAVGTPPKSNGNADLGFLENAVLAVANQLGAEKYPLIVIKSTVPPGTTYGVQVLINKFISGKGLRPGVSVAANPEFLREGNALSDAFYPDRIVLGAGDQSAFSLLKELYAPILEQNFEPPHCLPGPKGYSGPALVETSPVNAELIKYASNAFLAMKISFINEFAVLAELLDADIVEVSRGMGFDHRIGDKFLNAGVGWGGSCFGKDASAIISIARKYGYTLSLVETALEVNRRQRKIVTSKLRSLLEKVPGSTVGIMGLSFKPGTNDIRDTPATDVISELLDLGVFIKVYDPVAMENYRKQYPDLKVEYAVSPVELARDCDALVLLTEWDQFKKADWRKIRQLMKGNIFIDGRNLLDPRAMRNWGFVYQGVGRGFKTRELEPAASGVEP